MALIQQGPKSLGLVFEARMAVEEAQAIESMHGRTFGGHRHEGSKHPLLQLPLPYFFQEVSK